MNLYAHVSGRCGHVGTCGMVTYDQRINGELFGKMRIGKGVGLMCKVSSWTDTA